MLSPDIKRRALLAGGLALAAGAAPSLTQAKENKAMYGLIGQMKAAPGKRDELVAILSESTGGMPGGLSYVVATDATDADALWITEVWTDKDNDLVDKSLACHWNTPIHVNGFVYGSSGRHTEDADLRCVELKTGDVKWERRRTTRCTLTLVDGHFVCLSEYGVLSLVKVNPQKYEEVSKYEVPELVYPCWAPPVVSDGVLYLRGKGKLVALELIPAKKK